jgi:protein involved in polysaccharide export with SLBB domain
MARKTAAASGAGPSASYVVHFPDVLDVRMEGHPEWSGRFAVQIDGRVETGLGGTRAEGHSVLEIARALADQAGLAPEGVRVTVAGYNSQHVFLYGEITGEARAVPYEGPETVLGLLQRVGGITSGAAPEDIQVVRPHVADGKHPEVFEVDLVGILQKNEQQTNVRLQPFDQIYIGQTHRCYLAKCLPPWLRPFYKDLCGLSRPKQTEKVDASPLNVPKSLNADFRSALNFPK